MACVSAPRPYPIAAGCTQMPNAESANARAPLPVGGYPAILAECRTLGGLGSCRRVLDDCLIHLGDQLNAQASGRDRRSARQTLRELAVLLASKRLELGQGDYQRLLASLSGIFETGPQSTPQASLATTAPSYAGVVAAISRACPTCDYEAVLGQLLIYMSRLFLDRRSGWKSIYRDIRSIADRVEVVQRLDDAELARIDEWVESGAANLFPIQRELGRAINRLGEQLAALEVQIAARVLERDLDARRRRGNANLRNVVSFDTWRERRELAELEQRRADLCDQIEAKQGIKALIDDDIHDLEESLRATRRAYFVHLAWSAA